MQYSRTNFCFLNSTGLYWAELLKLRQIWTALNEVLAISTKDEKDNSVSRGLMNGIILRIDITVYLH